jgi:hypothetical protein
VNDDAPTTPPTTATPAAALPPEPINGARRKRWTLLLQALGFLGGVAMLLWCGSMALRPENRAQLARLADAPPGPVLALAALAAGTIVANGLIFWCVLRPVRRLPAVDVIASNALATFLAYLPFKLSIVSRILVHRIRDGVPVLTLTAWIAATAVVSLGALGPLMLASLWRRSIDAVWAAASAGAFLVILSGVVLVARRVRGEAGLALLSRVAGARFRPVLGSPRVAQLHAGTDMLAHPWGVAGGAMFRIVDVALTALRFAVAARLLGVDLGWQECVLMGSVFFLIGVLSPVGMLGTREGGTAALAEIAGLGPEGAAGVATVVLLVGAAEAVVNVAGAGFAVAWLRADRIVLGRARGSALL